MIRNNDLNNWKARAPANRVGLLLAGGDGTRLQELTEALTGAPIPKQYCRLIGNSSLLQSTLSRIHLFAPWRRISAIINRNHLEMARKQLGSLKESNIYIQPKNLDTGPGIVFALLRLVESYPDSIVIVSPTDHYINDGRAFIAHTLRAANLVSFMPDKIAILGIVPDRPDPGYGYILPDKPIDNTGEAFHVKAFTEKPSVFTAQEIIDRGGLWNTFVMVFKLSRMLDLLREFVPKEFGKLTALRKSPEKAEEVYRNLSPWNFSNLLLARIPRHMIILKITDIQWSDWGTRESIERTYKTLNQVPYWNLPEQAAGTSTSLA
jgi:mannose-1-phosphate guanylyltransferase